MIVKILLALLITEIIIGVYAIGIVILSTIVMVRRFGPDIFSGNIIDVDDTVKKLTAVMIESYGGIIMRDKQIPIFMGVIFVISLIYFMI